MLSPHTPPGTRVAFIDKPSLSVDDDGRVGPPTPLDFSKVYTLRQIIAASRTNGGFAAQLDDVPAGHFFCLSMLRRVDLPECLTSLLNVAPTDSGADKSITAEG